MIRILLCLLLLFAPGEMFNHTIYLTTGDSFTLYQGYVLSVKSVSMDLVWLQLTLNNRMVESGVVKVKDSLVHNKSNITILSVKVNNIYAGAEGQKLVSLSVHQFIDPTLPLPNITLSFNSNNHSNNTHLILHTPKKQVIWVVGIIFVLLFFYMMYKLW